MLSKAYFLAKFRFDTAENEPAKNLQNFAKFCKFEESLEAVVHPVPELSLCTSQDGAKVGPKRQFLANFGKMMLVFGCIGTDFCKKICVLQHFSKSTRLSS